MSAVSEWIVREYFEVMGFLVQQPRKYAVMARPRRPDEEVDLLILNPRVAENKLPEHMIWSSSDLRQVGRGIVGVRGWHTDRFSPGLLERASYIFRFAQPDSCKGVADQVGGEPLAKILCLPELSSTDDLKKKSLEILRAKGIDGVILFPTMLHELIESVEVSQSYEKSDLLQVLRILKTYDLLRSPQMEFFHRKRRHPDAAKRTAGPA